MSETRITRTFFRDVGGAQVEVQLCTDDLVIGPDLDGEANVVAARLGLVGELIAEYQYQVDTAEARYRQWQGVRTMAYLAEDAKTSEWKVKAALLQEGAEAGEDSETGFLAHKKAQAAYQSDLEWLLRHHEALKVKATMIDAKLRRRSTEERASTTQGEVSGSAKTRTKTAMARGKAAPADDTTGGEE